ncbi:hypothetical protein PILCRDRAFT_701109 [Piloderma croceum F 1598]|uniref:Secreted protein n=1 Tax=Piloderma croceum (strain F 1598) TaxID=765440 RepID=A0A0C3F3A8_PILCF|nr:hypothetical protein PILCRDRAFT_701109 [Piloderma croceum F 1598]
MFMFRPFVRLFFRSFFQILMLYCTTANQPPSPYPSILIPHMHTIPLIHPYIKPPTILSVAFESRVILYTYVRKLFLTITIYIRRFFSKRDIFLSPIFSPAATIFASPAISSMMESPIYRRFESYLRFPVYLCPLLA